MNTITELETELQAHLYNRKQGVATLEEIDDNDECVVLTFSLPRGETTFSREVPNTDAAWEMLYERSDARPPCIDELIGETAPVTWDEESADWKLDADFDELSKDTEQDTDNNLSDGPKDWENEIILPFLAGGVIWIVLSLISGVGFRDGSHVIAVFVLALAGIVWLGIVCHAMARLYRFYTAAYDWTK